MLLPFDAANKGGAVGCGDWNDNCGGMQFELIWQILFLAILIIIAVFIPFLMNFYESDMTGTGITTTGCGRLSGAFGYTLGSIIIWALALVIGCVVFNTADIPINSCTPGDAVTINRDGSITAGSAVGCTEESLTISISPVISMIGILTFIGWFCFAFFGGIGLPALPIDCIRSFIFRPKLIKKNDFTEKKKVLDARLREYMDVAEELKEEEEKISKISGFMARRKEESKHKTAVKELNQAVYLIEQEYIDLEASHIAYKNYNPLIPFCLLGCGIIGIIITILWILQIGLYVIPRQAGATPPTSFLNIVLTEVDDISVIFGCVVVLLIYIIVWSICIIFIILYI